MRVKIIDEYNRIPTRTQSALLTVMGDNYAEMLDHVYECPDAAWYLTANDDAGGGTYQVIEALQDRIDVVVKAPHFLPRFLGNLLGRIESGVVPEASVPASIIFTEAELASMNKSVLAVSFPDLLRRRMEFFASQFELCEGAAHQFEYKTKDTLKLSGIDLHLVASAESGKDRVKDLGAQTRNGLSVRSLMTSLVFIKAMAWVRGAEEVGLEDIRQVLPFVLHDKLKPDLDAEFFSIPGNEVFRVDRIGWIRRLFDLACAEYDRLNLDRDDSVGELQALFEQGREGVTEKQGKKELMKIEKLLKKWSAGRKLYGHMFDDILKLKYLHQRYTNYLKWLRWKD